MAINDPATIWRLHLRPTHGENNRQTQTLCLDRSVLGMGWSVDADPDDWTDYVNLSRAKYGELNRNVRRWKEDVKIGDLVWTKMTELNGEYFLAKVTGEWRYETTPKFVDATMVNIREVEFVCVGNMSHMPDSDEADKVVQAFRRGWTLQKINGVDNLSRDLWNQHCPPTSLID